MTRDLLTVIRQNHALEHATIAVLMTKLGAGARLMGRATTDGFYIYGDVPTELVSQSANEGLARLRKGERDLAVSPLCGTNLATAGVLAGLASMLAIRNKKAISNLPGVILAATTAVIVAQPLGRLVQKHLTTSPDLADIAIVEVTRQGQGKHTCHKIRTAQG